VVEQALAHADALAHALQARITLVRVVPEPTIQDRFVDPLVWQMRKSESEADLIQAAERLRSHGLEVQTALLEHSGTEFVVKYAQENGIDLIVITSDINTVSDVAHKLITQTNIPTLIVRPTSQVAGEDFEVRYKNIFVPLDGSQRAECVLPVASRLAEACEGKLILAHIVRKPEMPRRAPLAQEDYDLVARIVERNQAEAEKYLEQVATRLNVPVETHLLVGDNVVASLHELMNQKNADLVVLSAHGYSGQARWPYGSTTTSFINYGPKPVLVVQDLPAVEPDLGQSDVSPREKQMPDNRYAAV